MTVGDVVMETHLNYNVTTRCLVTYSAAVNEKQIFLAPLKFLQCQRCMSLHLIVLTRNGLSKQTVLAPYESVLKLNCKFTNQ